jgi:SNF2 family DNA or RNA helicase
MTEPMLVVVPAAIISNQVSEIKKFLGLPDRDVFVYRGDTVTSTTLKKKRIVITSFTRLYMEQQVLEETLMDFKLLRVDPGASHRPDPKSTRKRPRPEIPLDACRPPLPLFGTSWGRVVLDEGHYIRNQDTITFRAAMSLTGKTRIIATGTPFANEYTDVQSLFQFLRIDPLADHSFFKPHFLNKKQNHENDRTEIGVLPELRGAVLHLTVQAVMVRRLKSDEWEGKYVVNIPKPIEHVSRLTLDDGTKIPHIMWAKASDAMPDTDPRLLRTVQNFFQWAKRPTSASIHSARFADFFNEISTDDFVPRTEQETQYFSKSQWCNELRTVMKITVE